MLVEGVEVSTLLSVKKSHELTKAVMYRPLSSPLRPMSTFSATGAVENRSQRPVIEVASTLPLVSGVVDRILLSKCPVARRERGIRTR